MDPATALLSAAASALVECDAATSYHGLPGSHSPAPSTFTIVASPRPWAAFGSDVTATSDDLVVASPSKTRFTPVAARSMPPPDAAGAHSTMFRPSLAPSDAALRVLESRAAAATAALDSERALLEARLVDEGATRASANLVECKQAFVAALDHIAALTARLTSTRARVERQRVDRRARVAALRAELESATAERDALEGRHAEVLGDAELLVGRACSSAMDALNAGLQRSLQSRAATGAFTQQQLAGSPRSGQSGAALSGRGGGGVSLPLPPLSALALRLALAADPRQAVQSVAFDAPPSPPGAPLGAPSVGARLSDRARAELVVAAYDGLWPQVVALGAAAATDAARMMASCGAPLALGAVGDGVAVQQQQRPEYAQLLRATKDPHALGRLIEQQQRHVHHDAQLGMSAHAAPGYEAAATPEAEADFVLNALAEARRAARAVAEDERRRSGSKMQSADSAAVAAARALPFLEPGSPAHAAAAHLRRAMTAAATDPATAAAAQPSPARYAGAASSASTGSPLGASSPTHRLGLSSPLAGPVAALQQAAAAAPGFLSNGPARHGATHAPPGTHFKPIREHPAAAAAAASSQLLGVMRRVEPGAVCVGALGARASDAGFSLEFHEAAAAEARWRVESRAQIARQRVLARQGAAPTSPTLGVRR